MTSRTGVVGAVFFMLLCLACGLAASDDPVITVNGSGTLLKDGKPYRAIGVNYFSAFRRLIQNPRDTSFRDGFSVLKRRNIPFIRFMAGGFWPNEWECYLKHKADYFNRFDTFVRAAEQQQIGLIPSMFWHTATVPDIVGEPRSAWGDPDSETIAFMRRYVREVVTHYLDSPAIWAWEFGNEYNLAADLPNAARHRPPIVPHWGTPATRSEADDMTHDMVVTACAEFAKAVRLHDKERPITTGHSRPRPAAHHMRTEGTWTRDTREQFMANLQAVTPDPVNMISIHLYPEDENANRFGEDMPELEEIVELAMKASEAAGKPLFIGEFGAGEDYDPAGGEWEDTRQANLAIIRIIERNDVPLAAHWVFDLPQQDDTHNVTAANNRAYILDAIGRANHRIAQDLQKR